MVLGMYEHWGAGDRKSTSWLESSCDSGIALCPLSKYCFWVFFFIITWFQTACILTGVDGLPGHCIILLCIISVGEGIFGSMGVDCRSSRSSSNVLASWLVLRVVLSVFTCNSMKPLNWQKWGEDLVWSMCWCLRNSSNSLEAEGGQLSV